MYVVIGANGFLGSYTIKSILENTNERVIATTRDLARVLKKERVRWEYLDVKEEESVLRIVDCIKKCDEPIKIVYLSAFHHPDEVANNKTLAWHINVTCYSSFLEKMETVRTQIQRFVYSSTDSVYGESEDGYHFKEIDALDPVNYYGYCKCAAEALTIHSGYSVARFPFLISPSLIYKKHFYDQIVETIRAGNEIEMYEDSYRPSLSFDNAAYLLVKTLEDEYPYSILNICGDKDYSKYDVGVLIAKREGLDTTKIVPASIEKKTKNFITKRAKSTLMDNQRLKEMIGIDRIEIFEKPGGGSR